MAHMQISTETSSTWLLQAKDFLVEARRSAGPSAQRPAPGGEDPARDCEARGAIRRRELMGAEGSAISSSAKRLSTVFGHIDHEGDGAAGRTPRHGVLP